MLKKIESFIVDCWNRMPKTVKVALYLSVAGLLGEIASALLGTKSLDLVTFIKVSVANILLVLVAEIKSVIDTKK